MSDCCNDFPISCAPKSPGGCNPCGPCKPPRPCPPPAVKPGTSMYIGARYVPIFADPVYWSNDRAFEPLTIVVKDGDCYTSKCYVPEGAPLPVRPENQNTYWVRTSDYNYQFEELRQAVVDLSKQVEKFAQDNKDFTAQMQAWNTTMQEWSGKIEDWGHTMDQFNTRVEAVENGLAEEIARAKAAEAAEAERAKTAEAANTAAITAEADRAKGEETKIANRVTVTETDITAIKAEQTIQNNNISANAKNIQDNAAEIAKHAKRLTDLESNASDWDSVFPDTTIAQEVQKEENTRANAVTELKAKDTQLAADIEEVRDLANHKVDQTTFQAADGMNVKYTNAATNVISTPRLSDKGTQPTTRETLNNTVVVGNTNNSPASHAALHLSALALESEVDTAQAAADKANTTIGDWETDHPGQTISQCVTSLENEQAATDAKADANTAALANKADKNEIPDVSGLLSKAEATETYQPKGEYALKSELPDTSNFVEKQTYEQGQAAQNAKITAAQDAADKANTTIGAWTENHPNTTISEAVSNNTTAISELYANSGDTLATISASAYYIGSVAEQDFKVRIPINKLLHPGQAVQFNGVSGNEITIQRAAVYTTNADTLTNLEFSRPATITHTATEVTVFGSLSTVKMMGPVLIYSLDSNDNIPARTLIAK